ncbi:MAG: DUF1538 domain-containing protein [Clostridia bacterium]|nr:DUF1538 domain-containing protein [Clostridia bacterium]
MLGKGLLEKLKESVISVAPIAAIILILCLTPIVDIAPREIWTFVVSAIFLILGISLFNLGADLAMTPMGEHIGSGLTKSRKLSLLLIVCFIMGVLITVAEPDLSVLAEQVSALLPSSMILVIVVGIGVGLFLVFAIFKVVFKKNLTTLLMFFYMVLFSVAAIMIDSGKGDLFPLAFDSGGVTTGPITVPFIMALGVGVASTVGGRKSQENSFGLIALCSIGPMLAVFILSLFMTGKLEYAIPPYAFAENIGAELAHTLGSSAKDVAIALALIVGFFLVLQIIVLKLPKRRLIQIGIGIIYTFVGLLIFFTSVEMGFMTIGFKLGQALATFNKPLLIVISFVIGFVVVLAEPAVHVLNKQVEQITNGAVKKRSMLIALAIGVGISIGLSALRVVLDFSLLYFIIPGYILSLGLSLFVPKLYTAIAFDSGGVASGPLTASFILPMILGACSVLNASKALSLAFGVVAMVAMTPLIAIQLLGFTAITSAKVKARRNIRRIVDAHDEQIIEFM